MCIWNRKTLNIWSPLTDDSESTAQSEHTVASASSIDASSVHQPMETFTRSSATSIHYDRPPPALQPQRNPRPEVRPLPTTPPFVPAATLQSVDIQSDSSMEHYGGRDGLNAMAYSPTSPHTDNHAYGMSSPPCNTLWWIHTPGHRLPWHLIYR